MSTLREKLVNPLKSRKVVAALATVVAAYAAQFGFDVPESTVNVILAVGVAVILGTAIEDHGAKSAAGKAAGKAVEGQPLQAMTAEPIAPAIGAEVAKAVQAALSPVALRLHAALDKLRTEEKAKHTSSATVANGTLPKPPAPNSP